MKSKFFLFSLIGFLTIVTLLVFWGKRISAVKQSENSSTLKLRLYSDKPIYNQGEFVKLSFEVINETAKPIPLAYSPDVATGYLSVWIAFGEQRFNRYNNTSWGRMESGGITLQPGQAYKSEATVLYNSKPDISRLNVDSIKKSEDGAILSYYAFPDVGNYSIKAILVMPDETRTKIESEPIQIIVNEPVGDDLSVWNMIKDSGEIAYFIQKGDFSTANDEEREKLAKEVEQIVVDYPSSALARQLSQNLEKFKANEARRKEMLQQVRKKN
jgi:hypothetical protein